jgi:transposase-like protein
MAQCSICSHEKAKEINRRLLVGRQVKDIAKEFGFNRQTLRYHRRRHLPWRRENAKAVTVQEQLDELKYELRRLQFLAECGEPIGQAISAVTAQRNVLELEARLAGKLDATHRKLALNGQPIDKSYRVVFTDGVPKTEEVEQ